MVATAILPTVLAVNYIVVHLVLHKNMGKNRAKSSHSSSGAGDDAKHETKLQAVILADPFSDVFKPLSLDRCAPMLCPLNNVILLDYTMDFCAGAGVEELIVVCVQDKVENHVLQWRELNGGATMQVTVIRDTSLTNAGDALRELDKRNVVQSDPFLLLHGDVVTNVDLQDALRTHKERHKQDSSAIMTLLFKPVSPWNVYDYIDAGNRRKPAAKATYSTIRATTEDLVVGLDSSTTVAGGAPRIFIYDDRPNEGGINVPCSFLTACPHLDLRCDLVDCGLDICSPDVLARFSDEFDYRDIRREFVANSVAEEEEGLQQKLYAHILGPHEYAARVRDWKTYAAISHDLLRRWCYPIVPDNLPSGYEKKFRYVQQAARQYCYRERKLGRTRVGRSSIVKGGGMIGSHCFVGDNCLLEGTVIGSHCHIASNVILKNCHVWDGVCIEEGATVIQSILSYQCVIKAGATISRGCLIGEGCVIGTNIKLPEYSRITLVSRDAENFDEDNEFDDFSDNSVDDDKAGNEVEDAGLRESKIQNKTRTVGNTADQIETNSEVVGQDGRGRVWLPLAGDSDDEDEEEGLEKMLENLNARSLGFDPTIMYMERKLQQEKGVEGDAFSDEEDNHIVNVDDDGEDYAPAAANVAFAESATTSLIMPGASTAPRYGRQAGVDVVKELKTICLEFETSNPMENLAIELNSYKFSQNATYSDCCMGATLAILDLMDISKGMSDGKLVAGLKSQLEVWGPLLKRLSIGPEEEKAIIVAIEDAAIGKGSIGDVLSTGPSFRFVLQTLHDEEIISEETVLAWASERRTEIAKGTDNARVALFELQPVQDFLEWLEEETDDDDDEEDSAEEGGSEDE